MTDPGLCRLCVHAREIVSAKGSRFWRCAMSERVSAWPKYPPLLVLRCRDHELGCPP